MNRTSTLLASLASLPVAVTVFALQDSEKPADAWTQAELEALSKRIEAEVAELRGAAYVRPVSVKIASREDFLEYARQRMELTDPPKRIAADETIAKLLGVIPPDMDLLATTLTMLQDQVGGYYDPLSDSFSMMQGVPKGLAGVVLSHELGHALDDQLYALDGPILALAGRTDASLAYQALVEGSGTSLMNQWMVGHIAEVDLSGSEEFMNAAARSMANVPMWIWKPLVAAYMTGAAFLARTDSVMMGQTKPAASADVAAAFGAPPRSTEQVLHPEKYWDPAQVDEPTEIALETDELPTGWSELRQDTLGELMLAIVCTYPEARGSFDASNPAAALGVSFTNDAATGWDGDRVLLLSNGTARYLVLVTRFDGERDAAEFFGALTALEPTFEAAARALAGGGDSGADVAYGATSDEVVLRIHSGVERRDLRKLEKAFARSER
jgi:hypothetical protein